jgi:hypothetical protein
VSGAVQREHLEFEQPFAQRVLRNECGQLRGGFGGPAQLHGARQLFLHRGQVYLVEPGALAFGEGAGHARERGPGPQCQAPGVTGLCRRGLSRPLQAAGPRQAPAEYRQVDRLGFGDQGVSGGQRLDDGSVPVVEDLPEPVDVRTHR